MTNQELAEYYSNLLIIQYRDKPKAVALVNAIMETVIPYETMIAVRDGYSPHTAVGNQLDLLGKYIGVSRVITGTTFDRIYFGYEEYGVTGSDFVGYTQYGDEPTEAQFRTYKEGTQSLYTLTDDEYRVILLLKIIQNSTDNTTGEIDDIVTQLFGSTVLFNDRQNMTISYIFDDTQERLVTIAQSQDLLPRPMAVGISVSFTVDPSAIFSYGSYGSTAPSFAVGYAVYGGTPIGGMAKYG